MTDEDDLHAVRPQRVELRQEPPQLLDGSLVALPEAEIFDPGFLVLFTQIAVDQGFERVDRVDDERLVAVAGVRDQIVNRRGDILVALGDVAARTVAERVPRRIEVVRAALDVEEEGGRRVGGQRRLANALGAVEQVTQRRAELAALDVGEPGLLGRRDGCRRRRLR